MAVDPAAAEFLITRHRLRPAEALPWMAALGFFLVFPDHAQLGAQILIMIVFALSLDLILGYAGIVSLGHAAMFGAGAYAAGILSAHGGWHEPISGLLVAAAAGALIAVVSGWLILRTSGLTLLMLTLATTLLLQELANERRDVTGGADGLSGVVMKPVLGLFAFDIHGHTAFFYALAVLATLFFIARRIVHSPFGLALKGIRENVTRMRAIGAPVRRQLLTVYTIAGAMAGIAGGLLAQTTQFVALEALSFERSGDVLLIAILGGTGRLYGVFVGAAAYMILKDWLGRESPEYWLFGLGLVLVLTVLFAPRGLLGLIESTIARARGRQ